MKILYFSRNYSPHDQRFLTALSKTEHQVGYLRLEGHHPGSTEPALPDGIQPITWAGGVKAFRISDIPRLRISLEKVIYQHKPDLIQAGPIQTCALITSLTGFHPLVSTSWGSDLLVYADRNPWMQWATRYVMHHSDAVAGDCDPVRQKAVSYGMPNERIVTFPWGIDLDHFHFQKMPDTKPETFTLLSTRSWEPIYGVDVVANAFVQVIAHLKKSKGEAFARRVRLVMLGAGRQANLLRMIFEQAGIADQVHFPGRVSLAELPDYYALANIYISASHSDGTSISLLEAMACGRPVLVSDIPGNRQWITQGEQGWLFPDGDVRALAAGILKAIEQRSQLTVMGSAARKLVEQKADWQVNFRMLLHAYNIAEIYAQQS